MRCDQASRCATVLSDELHVLATQAGVECGHDRCILLAGVARECAAMLRRVASQLDAHPAEPGYPRPVDTERLSGRRPTADFMNPVDTKENDS